jgi:hypothetical protein
LSVYSSSPKGKKRLEFRRQDFLSMIPNRRVWATVNVMSPFLPHHQLQRRKEEDNNDIPLEDTWDQGIEFQPMEPNPSQRFVEYCTSTARNRCQRIGLQCSPIDVNTLIKAWREIFKNKLLDKIVRFTNEYGLLHSKRWKDISKKDLESFFAVFFISGIQKRKDKPSNWFSNNQLLENALVKKIMSGRNFFNILPCR